MLEDAVESGQVRTLDEFFDHLKNKNDRKNLNSAI